MWRRADPRYELPSRKYMNKYVGGLYEKCRSKVEAEINSGMFYAATTDMWTSRAGHPYMSLTGHYIDTDWNLHSRCLQTSFFPDDHTGENIAKGFTDALASWGLHEDRLVCVTTDNASNNILAFRLNDMTRLQCFGHRLHLAIGKLRTELFRDRVQSTDNSVHSEWDKISCDIEGSENGLVTYTRDPTDSNVFRNFRLSPFVALYSIEVYVDPPLDWPHEVNGDVVTSC